MRKRGASFETLTCYETVDRYPYVEGPALLSFEGPRLTEEVVYEAYQLIGNRQLALDVTGVCMDVCSLALATGAKNIFLKKRGFIVLTSSMDPGSSHFFFAQADAEALQIERIDDETVDKVGTILSRAHERQERARRSRLDDRLDIMNRVPFDYSHLTLHTVYKKIVLADMRRATYSELDYGVILTARYLRDNGVSVIQDVPFALSDSEVLERVRADLPDHSLSFSYSTKVYH